MVYYTIFWYDVPNNYTCIWYNIPFLVVVELFELQSIYIFNAKRNNNNNIKVTYIY